MPAQVDRIPRFSLAALTFGSVLIVVAAVTGGALAEWSFVLLSLLFPSLLILLGASAGRRPRRAVVWTAVGLALLLETTAVAVLLLQRAGDESWLLGLPLATTLLLAGIGLGPLILVPLAYAAFSDRAGSNRAGEDG